MEHPPEMLAPPTIDDLFLGTHTLYTIPPREPFLDTLAGTLLKKYEHDLLRLADVLIILPTRRAARALSDSFLRMRKNDTGAILLPRIQTLGDLDVEEASLNLLLTEAPDLAPPVRSGERRMFLANAIHRSNVLGTESALPLPVSALLPAADELGQLLDSLHTEQIDVADLAKLVPEEHATHWQRTLKFMEVITSVWPDYLAAQGLCDPAEHRRKTIDRLVDAWAPSATLTHPDHPVIIAGSTGSMPAVARLMRNVSTLPEGCIILPGLDTALDEDAWQEIEDPHPQAGMKKLLNRHFRDVDRTNIPDWPTPVDVSDSSSDRQRLISLALRPAEATADWLDRLNALKKTTDISNAVSGFELVEMENEAGEAMAIAIRMRMVLENPHENAIFVTPDRMLARRVSANLERWGIRLDDSAGVPFANTMRGNFLRLVANWLAAPSDPVMLLDVLKHPLCFANRDKSELIALVSMLDLSLRGLKPGNGFDGLRQKIVLGDKWDALPTQQSESVEQNDCDLLALIDDLEQIVISFQAAASNEDLLRAHIQICEILNTSTTPAQGANLWAFEDGDTGAKLIGDLLDDISLLPNVRMADYPDLFANLISQTAVRPNGGTHPRLAILGPLEARLQSANVLILGGLNEGMWPDNTGTDSFLSRPMRKSLGLPSLESRVGLAAHDFSQAACAREVLLTRSKNINRSPSKASRWLIRLKNILTATDNLTNVDKTSIYQSWLNQLDRPRQIAAAKAPSPKPQLALRPRSFSVSAVERLLRDPYAIYANRVLKLRPLDSLGMEAGPAEKGRIHHHILARFATEFPETIPQEALEKLLQFTEEIYERANIDHGTRALWHARLVDSCAWFLGFQHHTLRQGHPVVIEGRGEHTIKVNNTDILLNARADRIDLQADGHFIVDYKTGTIPSDKQNKSFSPQLQLTALILQNEGFSGLKGTALSGYGYIKVLNRKTSDTNNRDDYIATGEVAREMADTALENFRELILHYQDESTPYLSQPRPFYRDTYGDYDHLARRNEWAALTEANADE